MTVNTSEPPAQKTITERVETVSKIFSNIGGLFVPVSVAYFAYVLNQSNMDRANTNTVTDIMLKYEDSFIKLDDQRRAAVIRSLQVVGTNPKVIEAFLEAAAKTTDSSVKTDLQTLAAQASTPAVIAETAKSPDPVIRAEAQQVLDAKYMVVIASTPDQKSAESKAQEANTRFKSAQSDLEAQALPPGSTPYWGVYVGQSVTLPEARALVQKARQQGYRDAYFTRLP
jgi:hypothetical protein